MGLADLTDRAAVIAALDECDSLGREAFLRKYGFGRARSHILIRDSDFYDSKAVAGAAHGYQFPDDGPLTSRDFSGGDAAAAGVLSSLGFTIVVLNREIPSPGPRWSSPLPVQLETGREYDWAELGELFGFAPAYPSIVGGMIERPGLNAVLVVTYPHGRDEFGYDDEWDGDELLYVGRGQTGPQKLRGANRYVAENQHATYVFEPAAPRVWRFIGVAQSRTYFWRLAPDENKALRPVLVFRLSFNSGGRKELSDGSRRLVDDVLPGASHLPRPFDENRPPASYLERGTSADPEETRRRREKAAREHFELVKDFSRFLRISGWSAIEENPSSFDLRALSPEGHRFFFEMKTLRPRAEASRMRSALAQLLEYRFFEGEPSDRLHVVTDTPISTRRARFFEANGILCSHRAPDGAFLSQTIASE